MDLYAKFDIFLHICHMLIQDILDPYHFDQSG